jgi:hypothetical protein
MSLIEHAKKELALLNNDAAFNEAMIKAVEAFASYGHSGGSAAYAIPLLNDILQFKNVTPLTNDPKEWLDHGDFTWQSTRNPEAFSSDGGTTYYLLSDRDNYEDELPIYTTKEV